jgi:hypothetical protein
MSRQVIFDALASDPVLNTMGLNEDTIFHNYSTEERPVSTGAFAILRWGEQDRPPFTDAGLPVGDQVKAPVLLFIWVHWPIELTNDFTKLDKMLDQIDNVLFAVEDVHGNDGYAVTLVRIMGRSADLIDDGFNTITKNASYEVLARIG